MKKTEITEERKTELIEKFKPVFTYLNTRLNLREGIQIDTVTERPNVVEFRTLSIKRDITGIFKYCMSDGYLTIQCWKGEQDSLNEIYTIQIHIDYIHHTGGSNGHELNVTLRFNAKGKLLMKELYTGRILREVE